MQKLKEKIMEALSSVLPITLIVLFISVTVVPMPIGTILLFLSGAALLILGMGFFSLGADMAMMPMGEAVGTQMTRFKKVIGAMVLCMVMGILVTVAEPDLQVLARQVPSIPDTVLILTVAVGVGIFLVVAMIRMAFQISLAKMLWIFYGIVFLLSAWAPRDFIPMAFDSGGVTTGPITVPFIMSLGVGLSALSRSSSKEDSFGLVGLSSIGPILSVLLLSIFYAPSTANYAPFSVPYVETTRDVAKQFAMGAPAYVMEVAMALLPIIAFAVLFQLLFHIFRRKQIIKVSVGMIYTYIGLVTFLTGVNVGFMPAGHFIGASVAASPYKWLLIPIGFVMGYFIVAAEPAVHLLNKQVEELSGGAIPQSAMKLSLSIGVAFSLALSMIRILTGLSIFWIIIPGYAVSLLLPRWIPRIFTGIAFDSGGVASGPMTATFLLPFAMGACETLGGNILADAFGVVAFVAMTPLITIQVLGLIFRKVYHKRQAAEAKVSGGIVEY